MTIEVWAPRAARVRLRRPGQADVELDAKDAGWWATSVALESGDEYGCSGLHGNLLCTVNVWPMLHVRMSMSGEVFAKAA